MTAFRFLLKLITVQSHAIVVAIYTLGSPR